MWQDCIPVGCVPPTCCPYLPACIEPGGVYSRGGVCSKGGTCLWSGGGFCFGGVICSWGVPASGPGGIPACNGAESPCGQSSWHMLLKILPCPNFVAGGDEHGREPSECGDHWTDVTSGIQFVFQQVKIIFCSLITAHKRSLRRLCFYTSLSVILFTGGVCPIACWDTPPSRYTPLAGTPPG